MANAALQISPEEQATRERRRSAMAVLASSTASEIARHLASLDPIPAHSEIRTPQSGLVMLRGRIGGDGAQFNFGEATVSRAAIRLASGEIGVGYTLGRDTAKARLIALCDALIQRDEHSAAVETKIVAPIHARLAAERTQMAQQTAATKVQFFTLVRGED